jgi:hypothetical protein
MEDVRDDGDAPIALVKTNRHPEINVFYRPQQTSELVAWTRPDCHDLYTLQIMPVATRVGKRGRMIRFSVNHAWPVLKQYPNAHFLEFGVHEAKDICRISEFVREKELKSKLKRGSVRIHGFDSFEGLPEDWDNGQRSEDGNLLYHAGKFDLGKVVPALSGVRDELKLMHPEIENVELHQGWFEDTVPAFFDRHSAPVAFVHADADLYGSTMTFLEEMCRRQLLVKGTVITFDEFSNFENWKEGEYLAWTQIVERYHLKFRYICYHAPTGGKLCSHGYQSVSVVITKVSW